MPGGSRSLKQGWRVAQRIGTRSAVLPSAQVLEGGVPGGGYNQSVPVSGPQSPKLFNVSVPSVPSSTQKKIIASSVSYANPSLMALAQNDLGLLEYRGFDVGPANMNALVAGQQTLNLGVTGQDDYSTKEVSGEVRNDQSFQAGMQLKIGDLNETLKGKFYKNLEAEEKLKQEFALLQEELATLKKENATLKASLSAGEKNKTLKNVSDFFSPDAKLLLRYNRGKGKRPSRSNIDEVKGDTVADVSGKKDYPRGQSSELGHSGEENDSSEVFELEDIYEEKKVPDNDNPMILAEEPSAFEEAPNTNNPMDLAKQLLDLRKQYKDLAAENERLQEALSTAKDEKISQAEAMELAMNATEEKVKEIDKLQKELSFRNANDQSLQDLFASNKSLFITEDDLKVLQALQQSRVERPFQGEQTPEMQALEMGVREQDLSYLLKEYDKSEGKNLLNALRLGQIYRDYEAKLAFFTVQKAAQDFRDKELEVEKELSTEREVNQDLRGQLHTYKDDKAVSTVSLQKINMQLLEQYKTLKEAVDKAENSTSEDSPSDEGGLNLVPLGRLHQSSASQLSAQAVTDQYQIKEEDSVKGMIAKNRDLAKLVALCQQQINAAKIEALVGENNKMASLNSQLEQQNKQAGEERTSTVEGLESKIAAAEQRNSDLEEMLEGFQSDIVELRRKLDEATDAVEKKDTQIESLKSSYEGLQSQNGQLLAAYTRLERDIAQKSDFFETQSKEVEASRQKLQSELEQAKSAEVLQGQELQKAQSELGDLNTEKDRLVFELSQVKEILTAAQNSHAKDLDALRAQQDEALKAVKEALVKQEDEGRGLQKQLAEAIEQRGGALDQIETLRGEVQKSLDEILRQRAEIQEKEQQVTSLKAESAAQLKNAQEAQEALETKNNELTKALSAKEAELQVEQSSLSQSVEKQGELQTALDGLESQLATLREKESTLQGNNASQSKELIDLQNKIKAVESDLKKSQEASQQASTQYQEAVKKLTGEKKGIEGKVEDLGRQLQDAQQALDDQKKAQEASSREREIMQQELVQVQRRYDFEQKKSGIYAAIDTEVADFARKNGIAPLEGENLDKVKENLLAQKLAALDLAVATEQSVRQRGVYDSFIKSQLKGLDEDSSERKIFAAITPDKMTYKPEADLKDKFQLGNQAVFDYLSDESQKVPAKNGQGIKSVHDSMGLIKEEFQLSYQSYQQQYACEEKVKALAQKGKSLLTQVKRSQEQAKQAEEQQKKEIAALRDEVTTLTENGKNQKSAIEKLTAALVVSEQNTTKLTESHQKDLEALQTQLEASKVNNNKIEEEKKSLQNDLTSAQDQASSLNNEIAKQNRIIESQREDLAASKTEGIQLKELSNKFVEDLKSRDNQLGSVSASYQDQIERMVDEQLVSYRASNVSTDDKSRFEKKLTAFKTAKIAALQAEHKFTIQKAEFNRFFDQYETLVLGNNKKTIDKSSDYMKDFKFYVQGFLEQQIRKKNVRSGYHTLASWLDQDRGPLTYSGGSKDFQSFIQNGKVQGAFKLPEAKAARFDKEALRQIALAYREAWQSDQAAKQELTDAQDKVEGEVEKARSVKVKSEKEIQQNLQAAQEQVTTLTATQTDQGVALEASKTAIAGLSDELQKAQQINTELTQKIEDLEEQATMDRVKSAQQLAAAEDRYKQSLGKMQQEMASTVEDATQAAVEENTKQLQSGFDAKKKEIEEGHTKSLEQADTQYQQEVEELTAEKEGVENELNALRLQLQKAQEQAKQAAEQQRKEIADLQDEVTTLTKNGQDQQSVIEERTTELEAMNKRTAELTKSHQEALDEVADKTGLNTQLQTRITELEKQEKELQLELQKQVAAFGGVEKKVRKQSEEKEDSNALREERSEGLIALQKEKEALEAKNKALQEGKQSLEVAQSKQKEENEALRMQVEDLKQKFAQDIDVRAQELKRDRLLVELKSTFNEKALQSQISKKNDLIRTLTQQIEQLRQQNLSLSTAPQSDADDRSLSDSAVQESVADKNNAEPFKVRSASVPSLRSKNSRPNQGGDGGDSLSPELVRGRSASSGNQTTSSRDSNSLSTYLNTASIGRESIAPSEENDPSSLKPGQGFCLEYARTVKDAKGTEVIKWDDQVTFEANRQSYAHAEKVNNPVSSSSGGGEKTYPTELADNAYHTVRATWSDDSQAKEAGKACMDAYLDMMGGIEAVAALYGQAEALKHAKSGKMDALFTNLTQGDNPIPISGSEAFKDGARAALMSRVRDVSKNMDPRNRLSGAALYIAGIGGDRPSTKARSSSSPQLDLRSLSSESNHSSPSTPYPGPLN